ncbi:hypothetical protein V8E54_005939 [Elaphomyces granulatus]
MDCQQSSGASQRRLVTQKNRADRAARRNGEAHVPPYRGHQSEYQSFFNSPRLSLSSFKPKVNLLLLNPKISNRLSPLRRTMTVHQELSCRHGGIQMEMCIQCKEKWFEMKLDREEVCKKCVVARKRKAMQWTLARCQMAHVQMGMKRAQGGHTVTFLQGVLGPPAATIDLARFRLQFARVRKGVAYDFSLSIRSLWSIWLLPIGLTYILLGIDRSFGGLNILIYGDSFQFPPMRELGEDASSTAFRTALDSRLHTAMRIYFKRERVTQYNYRRLAEFDSPVLRISAKHEGSGRDSYLNVCKDT